MSNDLIQRILDRTDGGLDIILSLCPEAEKSIGNNRHFKLRTTEKTASASIKKLPDGRYYITDFGGDFKGGAINLYCYLNGKDLKTALKELGTRYQCLDDGKEYVINKPVYTKRPATELESGDFYEIKTKEELTQFELETLFSKYVIDYAFNVYKDRWKEKLNEVCRMYACAALISFTYVKDGEARTTESTDTYPIFVFTGDQFKKIYQPLADKKFRFRTFGKQNKDYLWGYARAQKSYNDLLKSWESQEVDNDGEDVKPGKAPKLEEIIICSGNGDALNTAALGYNVVWQNSESAILPSKTYNEMTKMAEAVYNLPDLDSTGQREAHKLALRFLDLKTIYLPQELTYRRDKRGNPCKDMRDYMNHYNHKTFEKLYKSAIEYKFWDEEPQFDKNGNFKRNDYKFNNVRAYNFIQQSGFHRFESKTSKMGYDYIQITNNVVKKLKDAREVKAFVNAFLEERYTDDQRLRNTFYRMNQLKDESLDNLKYVQPDFKYYDHNFQYFFFENKTWKVTGTEITTYLPGEINKMVWEDKVIQHHVDLKSQAFTISEIKNADGTPDLDIEVHTKNCLFLNYLINTSRIHWRKELETECERVYQTKEEQDKYRAENKFNIAGSLLTNEERSEQKKHLINKLFVLGYSLARYKDESKPWAPFLMDHKLSAEGESNGGSGKTIFANSLIPFTNFLLIDGKSKSLTDDKHAFESVTEQTEVILIDDLSKFINLESFFSMITSGITVNPKYTQRFVLPYETAPKILFTSNFGVKDITSSAERRLIYAAFSDYYHNNDSGIYREDRTPKNDFGKNLFTGFTEEEWNLYINTMANALQFYFRHDTKVNPPMDNVQRRNLQGIMGDAFLGWADVYFSFESKRLDAFVSKKDAFEDFRKDANQKFWTPNKFSAAIEAWCKYYRYIYNPIELRNSKGRVIRKWTVRKPDGSFMTEIKTYAGGTTKEVNVKVSTEMIYIKASDAELDIEKLKEISDEDIPAPQLGLEGLSETKEADPFDGL